MVLQLISIITITLGTLFILYRVIPFRSLNDNRPRYSFFPKYRTEVILPASIISSDNPVAELESFMASFGFKLSKRKYFNFVFRRGHFWGDISLRFLGLTLKLNQLPGPGNRFEMTLETSIMLVIDSGDLWQLLSDIKSGMEYSSRPIWKRGRVDLNNEYIKIVNPENDQWLACVANIKNEIVVEINESLVDDFSKMHVLIQQLDYYFGEKQEPEPWKYACYHCTTAANIYSPIRWHYVS